MNKNGEIVQRIESHYVGDDCIQVMAPYQNSLTVLDKNDIIFRSHNGEETVNKYITDERRKQFPYHDIPSFNAKRGFKKYRYHNELFNFEEPYVRIVDGMFIESFAVKDGKEALLLNKILIAKDDTKFLSRSELDDLIKQPSSNNPGHLYVMKGNLELYKPDEIIFPDETTILKWTKNILRGQIEKYRESAIEDEYGTHHINAFGLDCFEKTIDNLKLEDLPSGVRICDKNILIIRTDGNDIKLQGINVEFMRPDRYKVDFYDIPIRKYTLDNLRTIVTNIKTTSEPTINPRLNPGIPKETITKNEELVKKLKLENR